MNNEFLLVLTRTETVHSEKQSAPTERSIANLKTKATKTALEYVQINTNLLQTELADFMDKVHNIIQNLPLKAGDFSVDEIEFSAEITAKGSVGFLGTGGEIGGAGGLKFTFKRNVLCKT